MNLDSASTGANRGRSPLYLTQRLSLSLAGRRVALLRAPFLFEMLDCGIVSPRASIVAGHRAENTTDEVRPVAPGATARHMGVVRDVANAARSLHACRARIVGAQLRRAAMPTQRSMPPWNRGSEATVGAEGRRSRRRCKLSLRVAKNRASCATADASLSKGLTFGA